MSCVLGGRRNLTSLSGQVPCYNAFKTFPLQSAFSATRRFISILDQHSYGSQEPLRVFFIFGYIEDVHWANPECDLSIGQHKNLFAGPKIGNVRQEMGREKCERHFSIPRLPAT